MADMWLLKHPLFLLLWARGVLCGSINMKGSGEYSVLGRKFTFTCEVVYANVTGLFTFMRVKENSFQPVCRVEVATGQQATEKNRTQCSDEDRQRHTYTLTIREVSRKDSTVWQCQGGGMASNNVTLDVRYPPKVAIKAVKPCSGFTFLVNESKVVLNCTVKGGNPAPTNFTWYHGDVQLKRGADQIYTIDRVTRSSQGQYRCTADNGISSPGQANETFIVHYPPIVNTNGAKRLVNESDDLNIRCTAQANPKVTSIVWTKDGVGEAISGNGILHLKNITRSKAGAYICTATNNVTTCNGTEQKKNSSTVTVEVQYAPRIEYFGVTSGDRTVTVTEHDNVTLQCNISSYPASTMEIRNKTSSIGGRKISNYKPVLSGSYKQTLKAMLLDVSCQEGGEYTCSAGNLIGKATPQTVLLQVTCAPRRYSSSSDNLVFASNLHENATLSLTVIAFPPPTFKWRKRPDSRPISTTEVSTEGVLVTGSVTILDVKEEDLLNYTVNVENTEGELEVKIALVSKSRPYKPSNLKAANIYPRSVTLKWEKAFNGGATQMFNIQYRQHGGQWATHPSRPSEDDALQLDIDDLQPGTLYEIRMNALNDYGNSSYVSITVTTATDPDNSSTTVGVVVAVVGVIGVIAIIAVIIVKKRKNKHKAGQDASMADQREWDDARVVANNDLYETSADLDIHLSGPGAGVDANDVYAVVNKPAKTNNPREDIYAQPKKKKGQTKEKRKEKKKADIVSPALGAARGGEGSGAEVKEGQKTGIDEDGLLYVSVDFSGRPQASNVIIRSEEETEYSGIDFVASAVKKE